MRRGKGYSDSLRAWADGPLSNRRHQRGAIPLAHGTTVIETS